MTPDEISALADPAARAREAQGFLARGGTALAGVRAIRDKAIVEWGKVATQREIADALDVSPGLVGQIVARETTIKEKL